MASLKQLEEQGRALLADQKALVENDKRPWSQKQAEYNNRQKDIEAVLAQYNALKAVDGSPSFASLTDGNAHGRWNAGYEARSVSARRFGDLSLDGPPSLQVSEDDAQRLFLAAKSGQALKVEAKATATNTTMGGAPVQYAPGFVLPRREPTRIAELFPTARAESSTVDYYVLGGASSAAAVAEGAAKPESTVTATLKTLPMTKVATWAGATSEALSDFPAFQSVLAGDLVNAVVLQESSQLLNGDGTGANMTGILSTSGLLTQTVTAGSNPVDALSTAITTLRTGTSYVAEPSAIVLNPADLNTIRSLKATGSGEYIAGDPFTNGPTTIWGVPVVTTSAITAGTALVADFASLGILYVREGVTVHVDPYSQITSNITRIVVEERLGLAVVRPSAAVKLTGLNS